MKFYISAFFENPSRKFKCHYNLKEITGTLCEEQNKFLITSHSILFRMRNVSVKKRRENQNTHLMFNRIFFKNVSLAVLFGSNVNSCAVSTLSGMYEYVYTYIYICMYITR